LDNNPKTFCRFKIETSKIVLAFSKTISIIGVKLLRKEVLLMNKEELVQEVAKKTKASQKQVAEILSSAIDVIEKTVAKGKKVTLVGFGTFEPRKRAARTGRNPQTGKELKIPAKTVPAFSAGKKFKELVSKK
jgi:DNA-binding protein HU-beta